MRSTKSRGVTLVKSLLVMTLLTGTSSTFGAPDSSQARATIHGSVSNAATGAPLLGANIIILNRFGGTMADDQGSFSLDDLQPGRLTGTLTTSTMASGVWEVAAINASDGEATIPGGLTIRPGSGAITDPGSGGYTGDPALRNRLRSGHLVRYPG